MAELAAHDAPGGVVGDTYLNRKIKKVLDSGSGQYIWTGKPITSTDITAEEKAKIGQVNQQYFHGPYSGGLAATGPGTLGELGDPPANLTYLARQANNSLAVNVGDGNGWTQVAAADRAVAFVGTYPDAAAAVAGAPSGGLIVGDQADIGVGVARLHEWDGTAWNLIETTAERGIINVGVHADTTAATAAAPADGLKTGDIATIDNALHMWTGTGWKQTEVTDRGVLYLGEFDDDASATAGAPAGGLHVGDVARIGAAGSRVVHEWDGTMWVPIESVDAVTLPVVEKNVGDTLELNRHNVLLGNGNFALPTVANGNEIAWSPAGGITGATVDAVPYPEPLQIAYASGQNGAWVIHPGATSAPTGDPYAEPADLAALNAIANMAEGNLAKLDDGSVYAYDGTEWRIIHAPETPTEIPILDTEFLGLPNVNYVSTDGGTFSVWDIQDVDYNNDPFTDGWSTSVRVVNDASVTDPYGALEYDGAVDQTTVALPAGSYVFTWRAGPETWLIEETTASPSAMVGATATTTGAAGEVPTPQAGDQNKVLHGDATWRTVSGYRGEIATLPGLYTWEADNPTEPALNVGDWIWVQDGGELKRGAYKQVRSLPATTGPAWSGWYGDIIYIPLFDSTADTWSTTGMSWDMVS